MHIYIYRATRCFHDFTWLLGVGEEQGLREADGHGQVGQGSGHGGVHVRHRHPAALARLPRPQDAGDLQGGAAPRDRCEVIRLPYTRHICVRHRCYNITRT